MNTIDTLLDNLIDRSETIRNSAHKKLVQLGAKTIAVIVPELRKRTERVMAADPVSTIFVREFHVLAEIPGEVALDRALLILESLIHSGHSELMLNCLHYIIPRKNEIQQRHSYPLNRLLKYFLSHPYKNALRDLLSLIEPIAENVTMTLLKEHIASRETISRELKSFIQSMIETISQRVQQKKSVMRRKSFMPPYGPILDWFS